MNRNVVFRLGYSRSMHDKENEDAVLNSILVFFIIDHILQGNPGQSG